MLNICLVNNLYPPINTGSSFYTFDLANHLSQKGHNVIVITNEYKGKEYLTIENGIKVYRLPVKKLPKLNLWMKFPDFNFSLTPKNFKRIKKVLIEENIDLIHQCNNIFDLVFASSYFSRKLNIPLVCSLTTQIQHSNKNLNFILEWFDKTIIKKLFAKRVTRYIALDKETEKYINDRYKIYDKIELIPFSIPNNEGGDKIKNIKRDYKKTNYKLVSLGHVSKLKDRIDIIKAWKYVCDKYPKAKIIIIGGLFSDHTGKLIKELGLENNVTFTGRINHEELNSYLIDVDFGCLFRSNLPYRKGLGTANMELMASGIPVVADIDDYFFGENYPILSNVHFVKVGDRDPKWLANNFLELFQNNELREKIGTNSKAFIENVMTWERIINDIDKLYHNILNKE